MSFILNYVIYVLYTDDEAFHWKEWNKKEIALNNTYFVHCTKTISRFKINPKCSWSFEDNLNKYYNSI